MRCGSSGRTRWPWAPPSCPRTLTCLRIGVAVVLLGDLRPLRARRTSRRRARVAATTSRRSGSTAWTANHQRALTGAGRACASSGSRWLVALALIIGGAVVFVDAVESLATRPGHRTRHPGAGDRTHRHGAAGEVQQHHLDPGRQGHARDGQHHRARWSSSRASRRSSDWCSRRAPGASTPSSPESLLAFASAGIAFLATLAIFLPMWRTGRLRGRGLLVGGGFYVAYLALVVVMTAGTI